jgi:hypothetical protein
MTDETLIASETQTQEVAEVQNQAQEQNKPVSLTQDQLNLIIRREKEKAEQKARRELEEQYKSHQAPSKEELLSELEAKIQEREEAKKREVEEKLKKEQAENFIKTFDSKLKAESGSHDDYDEVLKDFPYSQYALVALLANEEAHTGQIMYELAKSPLKADALQRLAERDPVSARKEVKRLAASIEANKDAKASVKKISEPIGRNVSSAGTKIGKLSVSDAKRHYRF